MFELLKLIIGILILIIGFPIGFYLKKLTLDENKEGQKWFKIVILASCIGALAGLFLGIDYLLFAFLFMAIVTGMSLKNFKKLNK